MLCRIFMRNVFVSIIMVVVLFYAAGTSFAQDIKTAGALYNEKKYEQAYAEFEKLYKADTNNMDTLNGMAWSRFQMGKIDEAERMFKDIVRKSPYHPGSNEGIAAVNIKKYEKFNEAWNQYYAGDFKKAVKSFISIIQDKQRLLPAKEMWRVYLGLGHSHYGNKEYAEAKDAFKNSLKAQNNYDAHRGIGLVEFQTKNYNAAMESFNASLKLNAVQYDLASLVAWSLLRTGKNKDAIRTFKKQVAVNPYDADVRYGLAVVLHKKGDKKSALNEFYAAVNLLPGYTATDEFLDIIRGTKEYKDLYSHLGWSLYHAGLPKKSLKFFEAGIKEYSNNGDLLRGAGYAALKAEKYNESIDYCNRSLSIAPDLPPVYETSFTQETGMPYRLFSDAYSTMGWAYFYKNDYAKAESAFKAAMKDHPDWPDSNSGLGWVYYSLKNYDQAEEQFNKAIKLDPAYADAYSGLIAVSNARLGKSGDGWKYYYTGQYDKARDFFGSLLKEASLSQDAKSSTIRGLGWSSLMLKDYNGAERYFGALIKDNSGDNDAILGMGYVAYNKNNFTEAVNHFKKAIKAFPADVNAEVALGWSYYKMKDYANSLVEFRRAVQLNPYLAESHRGVGFSLVKIRRLGEGRSSIASAINIYPEGVDNKEFVSLVEEKKELADLYITLSWSYYSYGKLDSTLKTLELIKKNGVSYADSFMLTGYVYYKRKDYDNTINSLTAFLKTAPLSEKGFGKYSEVISTLAWSYYNKQDYENALKTFSRLQGLHKEDDIWAAPYDGMGWSHLKRGNTAEAKKMFSKALQLAPGYVNSMEGIAAIKKNK